MFNEANSIQGLKDRLQDTKDQIDLIEKSLSNDSSDGNDVKDAQNKLFALRQTCMEISDQLDPRNIKASTTINTKPLRNQIDMVIKALRTNPQLQRYFAEQYAGFFWQAVYGLNGYLDALERLQPAQYRVEKVGGGELPPQS